MLEHKCPFCNSDVTISKAFSFMKLKTQYGVKCNTVACFVNIGSVAGYSTPEEAKAAWEKRYIVFDETKHELTIS